MAVADPLDKCQWCKGDKVECVERTGQTEHSKERKLAVWLCPDCDGRALNFATVKPRTPGL